MNKTDLVDPRNLDSLKDRILYINPYAKIIRTENCGADLDQAIGLNVFSLDRILLVDHDQERDDDIKNLSLAANSSLDLKKYQPWFGKLLQTHG